LILTAVFTVREAAAEPQGANASLGEEKVALWLGRFAHEFAQEKGVDATTAVLREFQRSQSDNFGIAPQYAAGDLALWLAYWDENDIAEFFHADPRLMRGIACPLFVAKYGIQFHYIVDRNTTDGSVLDSEPLGEMIAEFFFYPDEILYYLGHNPLPVRVNLMAPGLQSDPDHNSNTPTSHDNVIEIPADAHWGVAHETAHTIDRMMIYRYPDDGANPLRGLTGEFGGLFDVPPPGGFATYDNYNQRDVPPGYLDSYCLVTTEDFARSCEDFVVQPFFFYWKARHQAMENLPLLYKKYLFIYRHIFMGHSFGDFTPEERALVSLRTIDRGNGNGRVEPGEQFALSLEITPFVDVDDAVELRCVPLSADGTVTAGQMGVPIQGLREGQMQSIAAVGDYALSSSLDHEIICSFRIECRRADGVITPLVTESVPLNESGYLWAYGHNEIRMLVKMSSNFKKMEEVPLPAEMGDLDSLTWRFYDSRNDCFWFLPENTSGSLVCFKVGDLANFKRAPVDPDNAFGGKIILHPTYNPVDGAIWVFANDLLAMRLFLNNAGGIERRVIDLSNAGNNQWFSIYRSSIDPRSGKVWLANLDTIARYTPAGECEAYFPNLPSPIGDIAAAEDGGCWLTSNNRLMKMSAAGAVGPGRDCGFSRGLYCHPYDRSLWGMPDGGEWVLSLFSGNGDVRNQWDLPRRGKLIPNPADSSVYVCSEYTRNSDDCNPSSIDRYYSTGESARGSLALPYCAFIGFQAIPPDINVKQGANTILSGGGRYDFGNTRVNGQGYAEFSIENKGAATLHVDSWGITGEHAEQFSVVWTPHQNIEPGNSALMSILFVPASEGVKRATVTIWSNDPDESVYTFSLTGTGVIPQDINVQQGGGDIPSVTGTYNFGDLRLTRISPVAAFVIQNKGKQTLSVGMPMLGGGAANQFKIMPRAAQNIAPGGEVRFTIDFRPTMAGIQTATVSIASNDPDRSENPYTFKVTGRGVVPDINIRCGVQNLPSGQGVYNYGNVKIGAFKNAVFTIENTGTYTLLLTPNSPPISPQDAANFQVTTYPAGAIAVGGNTLMVIRFAPPGAGLKSVRVTILSDDPDENPYTFIITGTGVK
jgi:hypothetical protein